MSRKVLKGLIINVGLMLLSLMVVFVLTELILRFTEYKYYLKYNFEQPRYLYIKDDISGYDLAPNFGPATYSIGDILPSRSFKVWTNELSCYDKPYNNEPSFVLLVGDSFTFGYVDFELTYRSHLENLLNIRTLKCGVSGYGLRQELLKIEKVLSKTGKKPKLVILNYFVGNDMIGDYLFPGYTVVDGYMVDTVNISCKPDGKIEKVQVSERSMINYLKRMSGKNTILYFLQQVKKILQANSIIFNILWQNWNWLRDILARIGVVLMDSCSMKFQSIPFALNPERYSYLQEAWKVHLKNIQDLKALAREKGMKVLVVIIPAKEQVYPFLRPKLEDADWLFTNKVLKEVFTKEKIEHIDLLPIFQEYANLKPRKFLDPDKDLYWRHDGHWNANGQYLASLVVAKYIIEKGLIDIENREEKLQDINDRLAKFKEKIKSN